MAIDPTTTGATRGLKNLLRDKPPSLPDKLMAAITRQRDVSDGRSAQKKVANLDEFILEEIEADRFEFLRILTERSWLMPYVSIMKQSERHWRQ